jgi:hypothetical protein
MCLLMPARGFYMVINGSEDYARDGEGKFGVLH